MAEGGDEQSGKKEDDVAEGNLCGDQSIHGAVPGVRLLAAFERGDRLDGGGAQGRGEPEEKCYGESEEQAKSEDSPVRGEDEVRGIVGRVDAADDKRRGPPGEDRCASPKLHPVEKLNRCLDILTVKSRLDRPNRASWKAMKT